MALSCVRRDCCLLSYFKQYVCLVSLLQGQRGWPELGMAEPLEEVFPGAR